MIPAEKVDELLGILDRIADALETLAATADRDEGELNVYVRGEMTVDDEDEDEEYEDDDDEDEDER